MLKVYRRKLGEVSILCLQGQLVVGNTTPLAETVFEEASGRQLILDFTGVTRVDAAGLGVLLALREHTLANRTEFKLMNISSQVMRVFVVSHLDSVFDILTTPVVSSPTVRKQSGAAIFNLAPCH